MDIGIDLGTANVLISIKNKIILSEPSVVAFNKNTDEVIAVGTEADEMTGKTPDYIAIIRPLSDGVISDYNMNECMITEFISRVVKKQLVLPRIIMCIPSSITDVESRAVVDAARSAGARKIYLIEEPLAALIGSGTDISKPDGHMVVDIGGGTTDIAVISMNGIVSKTSIKLAGNKMNDAIIKYVKENLDMRIGEKTAESAKNFYANVFDPDGSLCGEIKGLKDTPPILPKREKIDDIMIYDAIEPMLKNFAEAIKTVLENTPPELVGDIHKNGIMMSGGGAQLGGLDKYLSRETGINCYVADEPMKVVAKGASAAFSMIDGLLDGFVDVSLY